jgi:hypothetical protein
MRVVADSENGVRTTEQAALRKTLFVGNSFTYYQNVIYTHSVGYALACQRRRAADRRAS